MSTHKLSSVFALATICYLVTIGHSAAVFAEEPDGVVRTFGVISLSLSIFKAKTQSV